MHPQRRAARPAVLRVRYPLELSRRPDKNSWGMLAGERPQISAHESSSVTFDFDGVVAGPHDAASHSDIWHASNDEPVRPAFR